MPLLRIRFRPPGGRWNELTFTPKTFREEFPDAATGLPLDELATDYSHGWEKDGSLVVFETTFTMKEWRSIDTGIEPVLKRMIEKEEELRYPPELSPQVYNCGRWLGRPG